ncbi:hypothetical protein RDABS01_034917 [Bienertia sinuspersici]
MDANATLLPNIVIVCILFAIGVAVCMSTSGVRKSNENWEILGASALPLIHMGFMADLELLDTTSCGISQLFFSISFHISKVTAHFEFSCKNCSFLVLIMQFTLFMACMVISPYLISGTCKPQPEVLRLD